MGKQKEEEEAKRKAEEEAAAKKKAEEEEAERIRLLKEEEEKKKAEEEEAERIRLEKEAESQKVASDELTIEIGMKFKMGNVFFSVMSTDKYVKCHQIDDLKQDGFPNEIILEHNQMKYVTTVSDNDYKSALDAYIAISDKENKQKQEIKAIIDLKFKMGDIMYTIEAIGDYLKCKQCGDEKEFPQIVYLQKNQLNFVQVIEPSSIQLPDKKVKKSKDEKVKSPTANKIAMFEKKENEKEVKPNKPIKKVNKMKVGKLNSKFAHMNINMNGMKPGSAAKINKSHSEDGSIDNKPKVEQAIIKTKRRKRKKKTFVLDDDNKKRQKKKQNKKNKKRQ